MLLLSQSPVSGLVSGSCFIIAIPRLLYVNKAKIGKHIRVIRKSVRVISGAEYLQLRTRPCFQTAAAGAGPFQ
ncbi:hypothetical protein IF2G_08080 [Cordyceps javanica]|nr:hypothetical protein IF2G_08080 [Cordyceps javanica]